MLKLLPVTLLWHWGRDVGFVWRYSHCNILIKLLLSLIVSKIFYMYKNWISVRELCGSCYLHLFPVTHLGGRFFGKKKVMGSAQYQIPCCLKIHLRSVCVCVNSCFMFGKSFLNNVWRGTINKNFIKNYIFVHTSIYFCYSSV